VGLNILTSAATEAVLGDGHVTGVRLEDGRTVEGDMVIVSAGIRSRIEVAKDAGLRTNRGIVVDKTLRTSDANIYAAGDAAEFDGAIYGIIPAAMEQARVAALNMIEHGSAEYHGTVSSTTLKVVGIDLTCLGNSNAVAADGWTVLKHKDTANSVFKKLVLKDGQVTGAILMGDVKDARVVQQLIQNGVDVSAHQDQLLDPDFDLAALARRKKQNKP
jgi:nitrite reductase (NADH) large subunit